MVSSFGILTDQPLEFNSYGGQAHQIRLDLSDLPPGSSYTLEAELLIASGGLFTIFLDTPSVRAVTFLANKTVQQRVPSVSFGPIGTFTFSSEISLRIDVDLTADSWQIFLDGAPVHSGGFGGATQITSVRFATSLAGVRAAIDNIRISATPRDVDGDGVPDAVDTEGPSPNTDGLSGSDDCIDGVDNDGDGLTDGADPVCDIDGDGVPDVADNCPDDPNPGQANADGDGRGDACDVCPSEPGSFTNGGCPFPPSIGGAVEIATGGPGPRSANSDSSARDYAAPIAAAVSMGVVTLTAGGWYARRRWLR